MSRLTLRSAQRSLIGSRRHNEDRVAIEASEDVWCLLVSDGAGGHGHGAVAAQLAVDRVIEGFRSRIPADPRDLGELLLDAHDAIVARQRKLAAAGDRSRMQATIVVLLLDVTAGVALWAHVGDSRLYWWHDGALQAVTRDDSAVQNLIDSGLLSSAADAHGPGRNVLIAALGAEEDPQPHVSEPVDLRTQDAFLLCSDGWWDGLAPDDMSAALAAADGPDRWLEDMAQRRGAHKRQKQDNFSAVACWVEARPQP